MSAEDRAFYEGKIAVASFFAKNFLPLLTSTRAVLDNIDNEVMELDELAAAGVDELAASVFDASPEVRARTRALLKSRDS
jgi:hypothetical protein